MTHKERQKLIKFIKAHDRQYDYSAVDFQYYTDEDLQFIKQRVDMKLASRSRPIPEDDGPHPSPAL